MVAAARLPRPPPLSQLSLAQTHVYRALLRVDRDYVAVADQTDRPADRRLRPDMADAEAMRGPREPAVSQQRDLVSGTLAVEGGRCRQHLTHPRTAARPLVADDYDVAFLVAALVDRLEGVLLAVKAQCRTAEAQIRHTGDFDDRPLRREVAREHPQPAGRRQRRQGRPYHVLPWAHDDIAQILGDGLAGDGHAIAMQIAAVEQCLHQHRHAANVVQVLHYIAAAGLQIANIRRALADLAESVQVEIDARLVGDRRDVQPAIGRAAGSGDDGRGVLNRLAGDDVAGADVLPQQFHDRMP